MPRIYENNIVVYQLDPATPRKFADVYDAQDSFMDFYIQVSMTRLRKEIAKSYKSINKALEGVECYEVWDGGVSIYTYSHEAFIAAMRFIEAIPGFQWDYRTEEEWNEEHARCCSH